MRLRMSNLYHQVCCCFLCVSHKTRMSAFRVLIVHSYIRPKSTADKRGLACEQALLFGRAKRAARERASERRSREGPGKRKGELATISHKISFPPRAARFARPNTRDSSQAKRGRVFQTGGVELI